MGNIILLRWWSTGWIWIEQANVYSSISDEPFSLRDEFGRHGPWKDPFDCWTRNFWRPVQCHQAWRQRYNYNFLRLENIIIRSASQRNGERRCDSSIIFVQARSKQVRTARYFSCSTSKSWRAERLSWDLAQFRLRRVYERKRRLPS